MPPSAPSSPAAKTVVTPKVTITPIADVREHHKKPEAPPAPTMSATTLAEMEEGRKALERYQASRFAEQHPAPQDGEVVQRNNSHISGFNWTAAQQNAKAI